MLGLIYEIACMNGLDAYGFRFDPPMVMASPPVSDTVVLPHVEPASGTENDSVESPAGDVFSVTI